MLVFLVSRARSAGADQGFFLGGSVLVSCSTSTPINHIVFLLQNTSVIRKPQVISGGEGAHPLTLPLDPPLERNSETQVCLVLLARFTLALPCYLVRIHVTTSRPLVRLRFASKTLTIFLKYRQDNTGRV